MGSVYQTRLLRRVDLLFLFLVGREGGGEKKGATMQPKEVRAFLEDTTRAALIPAHSRLQQQVMTM